MITIPEIIIGIFAIKKNTHSFANNIISGNAIYVVHLILSIDEKKVLSSKY